MNQIIYIIRFLIYLFLLSKCTLAQHYPQPITPADSYNHVGSTSKPEVELVDQIESIEVTANQVVIQTSRVGPAETVKVAIQVVDIENGAELPPTNLTGILLILTRGVIPYFIRKALHCCLI